MASPKHLTADLAYHEEVEKVRRYTFLDKMGHSLGTTNRKGEVDRQIVIPPANNGLFSIKYKYDEQIVAAFGSGRIQVFNGSSGKLVCTVREAPKRPTPIMCVRCIRRDDDDAFFAAGINGYIYNCKCINGGCEIFAQEKLNEINCIDMNSSSEYLVSAGKDAIVRLYDLETGKLRKKWFKADRFNEDSSTTQFHTMRIFAVKFHETEETMFLSGGWDNTIKIWDVRTKESCVKTILGPHICGDALDIKDKQILTGSWTVDNSIQLWDLGTSKLISTINPINRVETLDGEFLYCCQFFKSCIHPDIILAGGSGTGHLEIISIKEEKVLNAFKVNKTIQAIDSNRRSHIAYGGMDPYIKIIAY